MEGLGRTFLARVANLRVLCVSSAWLEAGVTQATTAMRAPAPLSDPCSTRVSLLSLQAAESQAQHRSYIRLDGPLA